MPGDKVLMISWDLNPNRGSEAGVAHSYLLIYLKHFSVDVYTYDSHKTDILQFDYGDNVIFHYVKYSYLDRLCWRLRIEIVSNWFFSHRVRRKIVRNNPVQYKFMHIVTPAGYYAFNRYYTSGIKYIIGPINGGLRTPEKFVDVSKRDWVFDKLRVLIYKTITFLPGWTYYFKRATTVIVSDNSLLSRLPLTIHKKVFPIFDTLVNPFLFVPDKDKKSTKEVILLFSGRLVSIKGIHLLLNAFKICVDQFRLEKLKLKIAGSGHQITSIEKFISDNDYHKRVYLLGQLKRETLISEYQSADIFCLPTLREPGGTAILEAMSCELPVITSDYGGPSITVTEECGIKIALESYEQYVYDLAKAIQVLYVDQALRIEMGKNARNRVINEFSVDSVERKLIKVWHSI